MPKEYIQFFFNFLKNSKQTASVIPTSRIATKKVCSEIDFLRPVVVIEFGPGTGCVAEEVARRMSPTSRLLLIEANHDFVSALKEKFAHDERVEIFEGFAQNAEEIIKRFSIESADVVLANIPFTFFDEETRKNIVCAAKSILKSGGIFIVFPFTTTVRSYLREAFSHVIEKIIWQNIPPLRVFVARKE
jgi:phospholipid N-methyltransferase